MYQYTTTLSAGTHLYFFNFADATNFWATPTFPANYSLSVTSGSAGATSRPARSTVGHTIVAPSHSEDPDQPDFADVSGSSQDGSPPAHQPPPDSD